MKVILIILFSIIFNFLTQGQTPIDVAESTLKVGGWGSETFYYGFAEGDQLIFNFEEVKGKELKEVEIIELPSTSKFMDYKTKKIVNKTIDITNTGIYKFYFNNSAIAGRICKFKIQRVPGSEATKNFNTSVYWKTLTDTSWYTENEKYLASTDTIVVPVINNKIETVHSEFSMDGSPSTSTIAIPLPENTISWSYYLGVGEDAEAIYKDAEEKAQRTKQQLATASGISKGLAAFDPTGTAALASLALTGISQFGVSNSPQSIKFWFANDYDNGQLFMNGQTFYQFDKGDGPLCAKRVTSPLKGTPYLCLKNSNLRKPINCHIRIAAVTVKQNYAMREVRKYNVKSWKEPYLKNSKEETK